MVAKTADVAQAEAVAVERDDLGEAAVCRATRPAIGHTAPRWMSRAMPALRPVREREPERRQLGLWVNSSVWAAARSAVVVRRLASSRVRRRRYDAICGVDHARVKRPRARRPSASWFRCPSSEGRRRRGPAMRHPPVYSVVAVAGRRGRPGAEEARTSGGVR
jgi:hypothetical protein